MKYVQANETKSSTTLTTWFERDRAHVCLLTADGSTTLLEFWDEQVQEMVSDGFLDPKDWHASMLEYYNNNTVVLKGGN